jgi:hypothetical protein
MMFWKTEHKLAIGITTRHYNVFCNKKLPAIAASKTVAELLGCSIEDLNLALTKRHMKVNNENIVQKLTLAQVCCLSTYGKLSTIIVRSTIICIYDASTLFNISGN